MRLGHCFVCKTPSMIDSKNGVTCGGVQCDIDLPHKLAEGPFKEIADLKKQIAELTVSNMSRLAWIEHAMLRISALYNILKNGEVHKIKKAVRELFDLSWTE